MKIMNIFHTLLIASTLVSTHKIQAAAPTAATHGSCAIQRLEGNTQTYPEIFGNLTGIFGNLTCPLIDYQAFLPVYKSLALTINRNEFLTQQNSEQHEIQNFVKAFASLKTLVNADVASIILSYHHKDREMIKHFSIPHAPHEAHSITAVTFTPNACELDTSYRIRTRYSDPTLPTSNRLVEGTDPLPAFNQSAKAKTINPPIIAYSPHQLYVAEVTGDYNGIHAGNVIVLYRNNALLRKAVLAKNNETK